VKENGREQGLTDKDLAGKFAKELATARTEEGAIVLLNNAVNKIESGLEKRDNTKQCRDFCDED